MNPKVRFLFDEFLTDDMRDEIDELADRFPDLPDYDVIEHVNDVCHADIPFAEYSVLNRAVVTRYNQVANG